MISSRTENTKRNIISGLVFRLLNIIFPFLVRTLILYCLGEKYQGLSGLFNSILAVLNMTDLGFSTAIVFILYKPIANEDYDIVCAVMAYFRKVYRIIGLVILVIGLIILPFLPYLIKGDYPSDTNIYLLYLVYLLNSAVSYWLFAYKSALLNAMQRMDIVNNILTITRVCMNIVQAAVLLIFNNYYVYIVFLPIFTVINNLLTEHYSKKYFPLLVPNGVIPPDVKRELIKQVKGLFINRIGDVARNGADNIIISSLIGLTAVAVYNNYYYIYSALYGVSIMIVSSMAASVGNSIVKESVEKNYKDLCKFSFIFSWFTGWCTICMCCLYQPFMMVWMRGNASLMLSDLNMVLFCIYFYAITMNNIRNQYLNGAGLYWEMRIWCLAEAIGNIVLNLILGYLFGITGILLATLVTIILFNYIARNHILFKFYFKKSEKEFYIYNIFYIVVTLIVCFITYYICSFFPSKGIKELIVRAVICIFIPNFLYFIIYFKTNIFRESMSFVKRFLHKA